MERVEVAEKEGTGYWPDSCAVKHKGVVGDKVSFKISLVLPSKKRAKFMVQGGYTTIEELEDLCAAQLARETVFRETAKKAVASLATLTEAELREIHWQYHNFQLGDDNAVPWLTAQNFYTVDHEDFDGLRTLLEAVCVEIADWAGSHLGMDF